MNRQQTRLNIVHTQSLDIYEQLKLEEMLFRTSEENWCWINEGSPDSIVVGRFGKIEELIKLEIAEKMKLPVIRRFSGGGTVVVDQNTFFLSFIMNKTSLSQTLWPQAVMQWHYKIIQESFHPYPIDLHEQDLCIKKRKFAGQAQSFARDRFVHHSTFLLAYCPDKMSSLNIPLKQPQYRKQRKHEDFLITLKQIDFDHNCLKNRVLNTLERKFHLNFVQHEELLTKITPHRQETKKISILQNPTYKLLAKSSF